MTKQDLPSPQPIPPSEVEDRSSTVASIEATLLELETRASTKTSVLQEILARGDDRPYVHHWGINE